MTRDRTRPNDLGGLSNLEAGLCSRIYVHDQIPPEKERRKEPKPSPQYSNPKVQVKRNNAGEFICKLQVEKKHAVIPHSHLSQSYGVIRKILLPMQRPRSTITLCFT